MFRILAEQKKCSGGRKLGRVVNQMSLGRATIEGNSPVDENNFMLLDTLLEYLGKRRPRGKPAGLYCQS